MALALAAVPFVMFFAASSITISESYLDVVFCGWRRRYSRSLIGSVAFYTHLWKYNFRGPVFDYGASVLSIDGRRLFGLTGGYWRDSDLKRLPAVLGVVTKVAQDERQVLAWRYRHELSFGAIGLAWLSGPVALIWYAIESGR